MGEQALQGGEQSLIERRSEVEQFQSSVYACASMPARCGFYDIARLLH